MNDGRPTHLDLFSGIGGFALAAQWAGFRTIGFCEIDKYCQRVLAKNFLSESNAFGRNGRQDNEGQAAPERTRPSVSSDIESLDGTQFRRNGCNVTLLTGGFPCQPFSIAGKRRGKADDRHLWPEMLRVITEARPAWVLGENVAGIIGMELDSVLSDLEAQGYATRPFVIPACGVDARHRRNRVWIVANRVRERRQQIAGSAHGNEAEDERRPAEHDHQLAGSGEDVADAKKVRCRQEHPNAGGTSERARAPKERRGLEHGCRWEPEPDVGRVAHGIPARVDRLRGLGNAIVPQVAFQILKAIREQIENEKLQTPNPDRASA